jgi:uncharacterized protein (TIGR00369 family)
LRPDPVNTDRDLVLELLRSGAAPVPLTGSPLARELAGEVLELSAHAGQAVLAFAPPARFAQGAGVLQGGIVTALLDFAMAFAAHAKLSTDERGFSTASLNVHFLRPAPPARYIARGRIVRSGRKLLFAEAALSGAAGELIATASAVLPLSEPLASIPER